MAEGEYSVKSTPHSSEHEDGDVTSDDTRERQRRVRDRASWIDILPRRQIRRLLRQANACEDGHDDVIRDRLQRLELRESGISGVKWSEEDVMPKLDEPIVPEHAIVDDMSEEKVRETLRALLLNSSGVTAVARNRLRQFVSTSLRDLSSSRPESPADPSRGAIPKKHVEIKEDRPSDSRTSPNKQKRRLIPADWDSVADLGFQRFADRSANVTLRRSETSRRVRKDVPEETQTGTADRRKPTGPRSQDAGTQTDSDPDRRRKNRRSRRHRKATSAASSHPRDAPRRRAKHELSEDSGSDSTASEESEASSRSTSGSASETDDTWHTVESRGARRRRHRGEHALPRPQRRNRRPRRERDIGDIARKWRLSFTGEDDFGCEDFLEQVREKITASDIQYDDRLQVLPEVLRGRAIQWYRSNRIYWPSWRDFVKDFRAWFSSDRDQQGLKEDIRKRTQGADESARDYLICIQGLYNRLRKRKSVRHQLDQAYAGLRPEYWDRIDRMDFRSYAELVKETTWVEQRWARALARRPPPSRNESLAKEFAWVGKSTAPTKTGYAPKPATRTQYKAPATRINAVEEESADAVEPAAPKRRRRRVKRKSGDEEAAEVETATAPPTYARVAAQQPSQAAARPAARRDEQQQPPARQPPNGGNIGNARTQAGRSEQAEDNRQNSPRGQQSFYQRPPPFCSNCGEAGHFWGNCNNPRVLLCTACGRKDVNSMTCGCALSKNANRNWQQRDSQRTG